MMALARTPWNFVYPGHLRWMPVEVPNYTKITLRAAARSKQEAFRGTLVYIDRLGPRPERSIHSIGRDAHVATNLFALVDEQEGATRRVDDLPRWDDLVRFRFGEARELVQTLRRRRCIVSAGSGVGPGSAGFERLPDSRSSREQSDTSGEQSEDIGHTTSLSGYGADCVSAPIATAEAATSVVGDIVRDGTDTTPEESNASVESSVATGAAASEGSPRRPHHKPSTESGSDQR